FMEDVNRREAEMLARSEPRIEAPGLVKVVAVYVCPHPDCYDYHGSSGMGDLDDKKTYPPTEHVAAHEAGTGQRHIRSRSVCPTCLVAGRRAEDGSEIVRVLRRARVLL